MRYSIICPTCQETVIIIRSASKPAPTYCSRACRNAGLGRQASATGKSRAGAGNGRFKGEGIIVKDGQPRAWVWVDEEMRRRLNIKGSRAWRARVNWLLAHPGETLTRRDVIHHEDENTLNDAPDNLVKYKSQREHARHHDGLAKVNATRTPLPAKTCEVCPNLVRPWRRFCSVACTSKGLSGAGNPRYGKGATEHQKETQSQKMRGRTLTSEHRAKLRVAWAARR